MDGSFLLPWGQGHTPFILGLWVLKRSGVVVRREMSRRRRLFTSPRFPTRDSGEGGDGKTSEVRIITVSVSTSVFTTYPSLTLRPRYPLSDTHPGSHPIPGRGSPSSLRTSGTLILPSRTRPLNRDLLYSFPLSHPLSRQAILRSATTVSFLLQDVEIIRGCHIVCDTTRKIHIMGKYQYSEDTLPTMIRLQCQLLLLYVCPIS